MLWLHTLLYQSNDYTVLKHKAPESDKSMSAAFGVLESNQAQKPLTTQETRRHKSYFNEKKMNANMRVHYCAWQYWLRIPICFFC